MSLFSVQIEMTYRKRKKKTILTHHEWIEMLIYLFGCDEIGCDLLHLF